MDTWPNLAKPPIVFCAMEIRYNEPIDFETSLLKRNDSFLNDNFPIRQENFSGNINVPNPKEGVSTAQVSTKQVGYTYFNKERENRLIVSNQNIVFIIDGNYQGWGAFFEYCVLLFKHFEFFLKDLQIERISVRYINQLSLKQTDSSDIYFNIGIAAKPGVIEHPLNSYFIKYGQHIPDTNINLNVNHSLAERSDDSFQFIFDIDVLDHVNKVIELEEFQQTLTRLREIKNNVFFKSLTNETLKYYETTDIR